MNGNEGHLTPSVWEHLACDELPGTEKQAALAHIDSCQECGPTWEALREVRAAAETFDPYFQAPEPSTTPYRWGRRHGGLALAAALAAALGLALFQQMPMQPEATSPAAVSEEAGAPGPGAEEHIAVERASASTEPQPGIPAEGAIGDVTEFVWQASPTADHHAVELLDGDGALLWQSERLVGDRSPWPEQVEKNAGSYYWRIIAYENGQSASSDLIRFELRPSG